ncbi:MAG: prephenate dehydrogenase/arogenate dehydrogenase family protein [Nitrospiraceae bacterium]|nr:prephenate dehydrogenase/arogenate dehydrogenase family protein [Nitrospiraceae bacterium]
MPFGKITILGVGLIGASFGLAARKEGLCGHIAGFGRNEENLKKAKERGIIDSYDLDPSAASAGADLVMLSTPVGNFLELVRRCAGSFKKGAVVTDAGSVKGGLVREIDALMPSGVHYVGGHPIAGSDRSGIEYANAELFRNAKCIVTPTPGSDAVAIRTVTDMWNALGSRVIRMEPEAHDRVFAAVSHFPHLLAYAMINTVADVDPSYLEFGGQGFRDTTRIAASSPEIWRDICLLNKDNILDLILVFQKKLDILSRHLRAADSVSLEKELERARTLREGIGQG